MISAKMMCAGYEEGKLDACQVSHIYYLVDSAYLILILED